MKRMLTIAWRRTVYLGRDDNGAALVITLAVFLFLFIMVSAVYVVGETIQQKIELQNACDAAAYSAAVMQADGLSRMAVVNKAMSWTYVQMCKRQMDYITYRFLRLTEQRFIEDYNNAKAYHAYMSFYKLGYYPIPTFQISCKYKHNKAGNGWWCGLGKDKMNVLRVNGKEIDIANLSRVLAEFGQVWDSDGTTYATQDLTSSDESNVVDVETDVSNAAAALLQYYNESRRDSLLEQYNAARTIPVTSEDSGFQAWLRSQNYEPASDQNDEGFLAWLKSNGFSDRKETESDGKVVEYGWQEKLAEVLVEKFIQYTGTPAPTFPVDQTSPEEWGQFDVDTANFATKFNAWVALLSPEQCIYLALGVGDSSIARTIPTQIPANLELQTYSPPQSAAATTTAPTPLSNAEKWGGKLGQLIDYDKHSIELMYGALSAINANMTESMRDTAKLVLERNLKASHEEYLDDFIYSISIPTAPDPYETLEENDSALSFYFSALNNTEAGERVFLEMGTKPGKSRLVEYFDTKNDKNIIAAGLDQWFIRGGAIYSDKNYQDGDGNYATPLNTCRFATADSIGGEGATGIMRAYKSADINETGAGFGIGPLAHEVSRGNHYFSINIPTLSTGQTTGGGTILGTMFDKLKEEVLGELFSSLNSVAQDLVDCTASCENVKSIGNSSNYAMCKNVEDSRALYAEYDWASAKWWCFWKFKMFKKKWIAHMPFPKCFCGSHPTSLLDFKGAGNSWNLGSLADYLEIFPPVLPYPLTPEISHGYLKSTWDAKAFLDQVKPLLSKGSNFSREEYRSCVIMPDDPEFILKGHARIYGDDRDIWDSRYVGVPAKPWVLNEKFFNGQGTIVVGVARKHINPLFWVNKQGENKNVTSGIFTFFNTPEYLGTPSNYLIAMSAARAAVRRSRAGDPERHYITSYDNSADSEILKSNESGEEWMPIGTQNQNLDENPIHIGCVCGNEDKLRKHWNLSETDWDATLLPLRYARSEADRNSWKGIDPLAMEDNPFVNSAWMSMVDTSSRDTGIPQSEQNKVPVDSAQLLIKLKIY